MDDFEDKYIEALKAGGTLHYKELLTVFALNQKDLAMVQNKLAENGRYIVHGIKDKDHVLTSRFRDEGLTLDNVFDILSNVAPRSEVEAAYKRSLAGEKQLFGDS